MRPTQSERLSLTREALELIVKLQQQLDEFESNEIQRFVPPQEAQEIRQKVNDGIASLRAFLGMPRHVVADTRSSLGHVSLAPPKDRIQ